MRITSEFRESDMRRKLKDCQNLRIRDYQHRRDYVEGDKVWFQPLNGNVWIGPALVVTQRGQSIYLHTHGDLKKIAACRVKPYELVNSDKDKQNTKEVMKEDGLEDVDNLYTEDLSNYYYNRKTTHSIKYTATLNNPENSTNYLVMHAKILVRTLMHKHSQHQSISHLKMPALTLFSF